MPFDVRSSYSGSEVNVVTRKPRSEYSFPGACLVGMVSAEPRSLHANQRQLTTLARQGGDSPDEQTALSPRLCARGKRPDAECRFRKAGPSRKDVGTRTAPETRRTDVASLPQADRSQR